MIQVLGKREGGVKTFPVKLSTMSWLNSHIDALRSLQRGDRDSDGV